MFWFERPGSEHHDKPIERWNKISLRDDRQGHLELKNLKVFEARSEEDALNLLFLGNVHRMTAETPMNHVRERSEGNKRDRV